jgi:DNA-binding NtrC family response regulator
MSTAPRFLTISGADSLKPGLFEMANTGTLFLDEIGELEPRMQVKLLRVLDGVPYYRLGGQKKVQVNTRILAATNQDLEAAVRAGTFRSDLYHRLNQCQLKVPPLRERIDDIIPLAQHFLKQQCDRTSFTEEAKQVLRRHDWAGNARELRNVVTAALIRADGDQIGAQDLGGLKSAEPMGPRPAGDLRLDGLERAAILEALKKTAGHHQQAADLLGISRRTLSRKLKLYGPDLKEEPDYAYGTTLGR